MMVIYFSRHSLFFLALKFYLPVFTDIFDLLILKVCLIIQLELQLII
jgi:hypothetical protein